MASTVSSERDLARAALVRPSHRSVGRRGAQQPGRPVLPQGAVPRGGVELQPRARARPEDGRRPAQPRDRLQEQRLLRPAHHGAAGARCGATRRAATPRWELARAFAAVGQYEEARGGVHRAARPEPARPRGADPARPARAAAGQPRDGARVVRPRAGAGSRTRRWWSSIAARCSTTSARTTPRSSRWSTRWR